MTRFIALPLLSVTIGAVAWSGEPLLLPLALLFPTLWALSSSRAQAALVSAGYFLAASRGLPLGVANFYGSGLSEGIALWIAASIGFVAVHALFWTSRKWSRRAVHYAAIAVVLALPPVGIVGWAHPITAAGILFPGWSWLGLSFTAAILVAMTSRAWPISAILFAGFWTYAVLTWSPPRVLDGWAAIDTEFGGNPETYAGYDQHRTTIRRVLAASDAGAAVVVLPESALGLWTPTVERMWTDALHGRDVIVYGGAVIVDQTGYDNVMLTLTGQGASLGYRQRMPVPVSMWQPWLSLIGAPAGARADFFANPVVVAGGVRIATLICYEQLLIWPIIQSAFLAPDVLVAPANGWWTADTDIVPIQIAATTAWARLFDLPLTMAINT